MSNSKAKPISHYEGGGLPHRNDPTQPPLVVPVILNWNKEELTLDTLASLREQDYPRMQSIVVDNGSQNQQEALAKIKRAFPEVQTYGIRPPNVGFTGGCNTGMRLALEAGADYLFVINNDILLDPSAISELITVLEADSSVGAASPLMYYASEPDRIWFGGGKLLMGGRVLPEHGEENNITPDSPPQEADWLTGTAIMVRREAIEQARMLDRRYFLYWEDVDWTLALRKAGYRLLLVPSSVIWHRVSATMGEMPLSVLYYWERNRLYFIERWGDWRSKMIAWGKIAWRLLAWRFKDPTANPLVPVKLQAYTDYLLRRTGRKRE
ncbi:MAG: glycosyltransferase family 2 protein [Chloroflexota bacterium]|nr:glycosyltransferase family 2 protein [Chloroflexota bacterium]MDQ5865498.1 glycosyltransferase family 2 protein [Chloroflexota bacterium]